MQQPTYNSIRLILHAPSAALDLTCCGHITAGIPLEAIEDRQRTELQDLLTTPGRYALQVGDDSMCQAGILSGDIVVVQSQQRAASGDIVVALLDGEQVVLKRVRFVGGKQIRLLADNSAESDRLVDASRLAIQGRVVAQVRCYR